MEWPLSVGEAHADLMAPDSSTASNGRRPAVCLVAKMAVMLSRRDVPGEASGVERDLTECGEEGEWRFGGTERIIVDAPLRPGMRTLGFVGRSCERTRCAGHVRMQKRCYFLPASIHHLMPAL